MKSIDVAQLSDQGVQNLIDNHRRLKATDISGKITRPCCDR